jgi:hypothetical protein
LTKEIRDGFEEYRSPARHPLFLMVEKSRELGDKGAAREAETHGIRASLFAGTVASTTWKEIKAALEEDKARRSDELSALREDWEALLRERGEMEKVVGGAEEGLRQARKVLDKALAEERRWDARQVLFRRTAKFFADASAEFTERMDLGRLREEIFRTKIPVESRDTGGSPQAGDATVGDILIEQREDVRKLPLDELLKRFTVSDVDPRSEPALVATMLSFSSDLADIEREKARIETEYLKARIDLLAARAVPSRAGENAYGTVADILHRNLVLPEETVRATIDRLRRKEVGETDARAVLRAVADYAVSRTNDRGEAARLSIRREELEREISLRRAILDARGEEALIARGLQGLAIYHEGGITPETVANFLRGAQAAALALIGVGLN